MWCLWIRKWPSIQVFDGYLCLPIHIQETSSFSAGNLTGGCCPHELWEIHTIMVLCQHKDLPCCLAMRISKVGRNFGTSLRRHTQTLTSPILQSSLTRTKVLYWRWKTLSLWREGPSVASIADRTLSRNAVAKMVKKCFLLCGCTIYSLVASQLHHFQLQEKSTRIRCFPQTATTSSTLQKKCNSLPQGVLRAI